MTTVALQFSELVRYLTSCGATRCEISVETWIIFDRKRMNFAVPETFSFVVFPAKTRKCEKIRNQDFSDRKNPQSTQSWFMLRAEGHFDLWLLHINLRNKLRDFWKNYCNLRIICALQAFVWTCFRLFITLRKQIASCTWSMYISVEIYARL